MISKLVVHLFQSLWLAFEGTEKIQRIETKLSNLSLIAVEWFFKLQILYSLREIKVYFYWKCYYL